MAILRRFEEIEPWQKARRLTSAVYACSGSGDFAKDFVLRDQIRSAAVSITSDIAQGFERGVTTEVVQFLAMAKGSAGEGECQRYIAPDQGSIKEQEFQSLKALTSSTKRLLAGFIGYLVNPASRAKNTNKPITQTRNQNLETEKPNHEAA